MLHFIELNETQVKFIWASEESGFRHLYLITSSLGVDHVSGESKELNGDVMKDANNAFINLHSNNSDDLGKDFGYLTPNIIKKETITSGEWEVVDKHIWLDKKSEIIYFLGLRETPLEKHLYAVSLQQPNYIRLLTEKGFSFSFDFNDVNIKFIYRLFFYILSVIFELLFILQTCTIAVQSYCNLTHLPACEVLKVTNTYSNYSVDGIKLSPMGHIMEGGITQNQQYCPIILSSQLSSGETIYSMVFKPHNFMTGVKYPTVLNVYGGPEVQTVSNTFKVHYLTV